VWGEGRLIFHSPLPEFIDKSLASRASIRELFFNARRKIGCTGFEIPIEFARGRLARRRKIWLGRDRKNDHPISARRSREQRLYVIP